MEAIGKACGLGAGLSEEASTLFATRDHRRRRVTTCSICGGGNFSSNKVLWPRLIADWQLSEAEIAYIDEQQGRICGDCGANLRVVALGNAVRNALGTDLSIRAYACSPVAPESCILQSVES